ncbi:MAG: hypothetical protein KAS65_13300 [Candidatus Aminicenantes bacterium]|nr:hypothetical protein [Candidatus Aminicenantes bacterium]
MKEWQNLYSNKHVSTHEALSKIRNGQTIFIGSGCGEPLILTEALAGMAPKFWDLQIIHLSAQAESKLAKPELVNSFRYNTFYIGRGLEKAVANGTADYTPIDISRFPSCVTAGIISIDVALIQVSTPDTSGNCSLGISVDAVKTAVENADLVIAQINENMPVTMGDSMIPVDKIHYLIDGTAPLTEVPGHELDPVSLTIGRYIARLITDGTTLHFDRSVISTAAMRYLDSKRHLGIHTDILTDEVFRLLKSGVITNKKKSFKKNKIIATMVMGSHGLYQNVNQNPNIEIHPINFVNDPFIIAKNKKMVSVLSIEKIELSGMPWADIGEASHINNLPSSMDFVIGSNRSENGFSIMALHSTSPDGTESRIVAERVAKGVSFSRSKVDFVVTEYGYVYLYGLSYRERAIALISIAHPKFRKQLLKEAKKFNYVGKNQIIVDCPESGMVYPHHYECTHTFKGGLEVFFRPIKPSDARRMQLTFYSLSLETIRMRYHGSIKKLSNETAQMLCNIDYSKDMAIVGLVGPRENPRIVAEGRYTYNPSSKMGEFDIIVHDDYQRLGLGIFLANYLKKIAYASGLSGVYAEVIPHHGGAMGLLNRAWPTAKKQFELGTCTFVVKFPEEDLARPKGSIIVYSGRFSDYSYGEEHPYKTDRATITLNLINRQGYLNEPWMKVEEPKMMTKKLLIESHDPGFISALEKCNSGQFKKEFLLNYNLGGDDCPIFPGLFDYIMLYTSATFTGVERIIKDKVNIAFNFVGGFHHASRNHAEGFCYINDIIVAIDTFLAHGYRVAYIDLDAHHGNGVESAYYRDDRVLTVSLHESGKTLYPWSGFKESIGEDIGKGFNINIPLPVDTDDEAYEWVFDRLVTPAVSMFKPTVVVAVVGADSHKSDPLSNLKLTNGSMANLMKTIRDYSHHLLLLGGGGYNIKSTSRAWCRVWAAANRIDAMPDYLLVLGGTFMGSQELQGAEIVDREFRISGTKKKKIMSELEDVVRFHEKNTFPIIKKYYKSNNKS